MCLEINTRSLDQSVSFCSITFGHLEEHSIEPRNEWRVKVNQQIIVSNTDFCSPDNQFSIRNDLTINSRHN